MADRRESSLADCRAVILARRGRAAAEESRMREAASAAEAALHRTEKQLAAADLQWRRHLESRFDPMTATLLARQVLERVLSQEGAMAEERAATAAHRDAVRVWRGEDAKLRSVTDMLSDRRRAIYRKSEENRLAALADRVSFAWSRR